MIACDFNTTFYNRSGYNLKEAMLDFTWKDTSLEDVIKQEKEEDAENRTAMPTAPIRKRKDALQKT